VATGSFNTEGSSELAAFKVLVTDKFDSLDGTLALLQDRANTSDKNMDSGFKRLEESFKKNMNFALRGPAPHQEITPAGQSSQHGAQGGPSYNRPGPNHQDCFYCYLTGHMVRDCPFKREHIDLGRIIIEAGRMKLGDGTAFPKWPPEKSQKQRVDDYYLNRPVPGVPQVMMQIYTLPRIENITQFHVSLADNILAVYDYRDDEIRTLQAQRAISDNISKSNQFIQGSVQAPVLSSNMVQSYNTNTTVAAPKETQGSAPSGGFTLPGGWSFDQLVQIVDAARGVQFSANDLVDQLASTRSSGRENNSGGSKK
jgi:hypothetical protein